MIYLSLSVGRIPIFRQTKKRRERKKERKKEWGDFDRTNHRIRREQKKLLV